MYGSNLSGIARTALLMLLMLAGDPALAQRFSVARAVSPPDQSATLSVTLSPLGNAEVSGGTLTLSFDDGSDEDWLVQIRGVDVPNQPHLAIQALDPVQNPEFHPLLEIFDTQRLVDDSQPPLLVIGDCDLPPTAIDQPIPELTQTRLLRLSHCGPVPASGIDYRVIRRQGINNASGISVVQGRVSEAINDRPVQVLIFSDSNQIGVSGSQDGRYLLTLLANQQATLRVISEDFVAEPLTVGPLAENAISNDNDFAVSRASDSIYSDGFEDLPQ